MTTTRSDTLAIVLALRMWRSLLATQELLTIYLGVRLELYETLAACGPATTAELAHRAGIAPRYAREWAEQQAVAGILTVDSPASPAERMYSLPAGHAEVLTVSDSAMSMAALAVLPLGGVAAALPALLDAYRTGDGVPDAVYGVDWRAGHSGSNRAVFTEQLPEWIAGFLPDVHAELAHLGRTVADVACGTGWSSMALARAYPSLRVHGMDLDDDAITEAREHAARAGLADRVTFEVRDAATVGGETASYDLVCLFDALHEMPHPVEVLRACRALCAPSGTVLVMDAKVAASFTAPGDEVERFQYGTSVLHCLPAGRAAAGSTATGTVLRPAAVRELAVQAGFAAVTVLPVEDRFHRLYRLIG